MSNQTPTSPVTNNLSNYAGDTQTGSSYAQVMDAFESAVISAYEQAVQNGVSPYSALAIMLDLASLETQRLTAPDR